MVVEALQYNLCQTLERRGLFAALKLLNGSTDYRFTGIYQFEGRWVKSVWLYDREHPNVQLGSDVLWDDSYCRMTAEDGDACEITNSLADLRLASHAARLQVQCYVAVLLRTADNAPLGTLCHYDVLPRATPVGIFDALRTARTVLEPILWTALSQHRM